MKSPRLLIALAPLVVLAACAKPDETSTASTSSGMPVSSAPVAIASTAATPSASASAPPPAAGAGSSIAAADDPLVGNPAPDFTAKTQDGKTVHLAALKGKKVVLYFYPKDETPGCTTEACSFRDAFAEIAKTGAVLIGVSKDDLDSHKAFAENHKLPFSLISDADGAIAKAYSVPVREGHTARQTFVIGKDGKVAKVYRSVFVQTHASEILADVKS